MPDVRILSRLRPRALPDTVRASLDLERGERVVAFARGVPAGYAVATDRALHTPDGAKVGWEQVEHVDWREGTMHVRETAPAGTVPPEHHLRLATTRTFPDVVHERVRASILISQYERLDEKRGVRVAARRRPATGEVVWTLVFDSGLDPRDPQTRARAHELLRRIRQQTGL